MLTIKLNYDDGSDLLRACKDYSIVFDKYDRVASYMLIRGKENIISKLGRYMLDCYTGKIRHTFRKKPIKLEQPEIEYLKAVFSSVDFKQKPFLIPVMTQFLTNYDKFYDQNQIPTN